MKLKKLLCGIVALVLVLLSAITVGAVNPIYDTIEVAATQSVAANVTYSLSFYSNMRCVRADNMIYYVHSDETQFNLPAYVYLHVSYGTGYHGDTTVKYLTKLYDVARIDYYLPAGKVLSYASASYRTNYAMDFDGRHYYQNGNFTDAYGALTYSTP